MADERATVSASPYTGRPLPQRCPGDLHRPGRKARPTLRHHQLRRGRRFRPGEPGPARKGRRRHQGGRGQSGVRDGERLRPLPRRRGPGLRVQHKEQCLRPVAVDRRRIGAARGVRPLACVRRVALSPQMVEMVTTAIELVKGGGGSVSFDPNIRKEVVRDPEVRAASGPCWQAVTRSCPVGTS